MCIRDSVCRVCNGSFNHNFRFAVFICKRNGYISFFRVFSESYHDRFFFIYQVDSYNVFAFAVDFYGEVIALNVGKVIGHALSLIHISFRA